MSKHKKSETNSYEEPIVQDSDTNEKTPAEGELQNDPNQETTKDDASYEVLRSKLSERTKKCEEYYSMAQRLAAEFDNYKKRVVREKEQAYEETRAETIEAMLPVLDNMERAFQAFETSEATQAMKDGVELVLRQFKDALKKLGVEEIKSIGEAFDHNFHNAVMHVEDEIHGQNTVIEEFQKGYRLKERVIRHSVVKVAN